jgi:hypothetical protein
MPPLAQNMGASASPSGSRPSDQAQFHGPAAPRFDPSRIAEAVAQVEPSLLAPIIKKAADEFYCSVLETAEDYLRDNLDWNLKSHVQMLERENQRMRTELYDVDRIVGPPWCAPDERIKRLREMDTACAQLIELRYAVQFDSKRAKAIAIEARQRTDRADGLDPKGESAGPQDIAQRRSR